VLREYERRSNLAQELLDALDGARKREKGMDSLLQDLKRCAAYLLHTMHAAQSPHAPSATFSFESENVLEAPIENALFWTAETSVRP
jgi:hypothetical protein